MRQTFVTECFAMSLLSRTEHSLPGSWYYDAVHYARELDAVWYRDWVCVGRLEEIPRAGDFFVAGIGSSALDRDPQCQGRVARFPQYLPSSRFGLCTERSRPVSQRPHRLPVPHLDLQPGRRSRCHAVTIARSGFPGCRLFPVPCAGRYLGRLHLCQSFPGDRNLA